MHNGRRVSLPVLLVLMAFLAGAGFLVYRASEGGVAPDRERSSMVGEVDAEPWGAHSGGPEGWRHHDWTGGPEDLGAEGDEGREHHHAERWWEDDEGPYDPQLRAMERSYHVEGDAGVGSLPFSPLEHEAQIVAQEGSGATGAASCQVRVLPVEAGQFNCLVRVMCAGQILYPNQTETAGYVPCELDGQQPVRAVDDGHTGADGDPLVNLDLRAGTVTVEDRVDGVTTFRTTLRIGRRI